MIFKQWFDILQGRKTQTRRLVKPGEEIGWRNSSVFVCTPAGRMKWAVGRTYAVVPKRGEPAIWWQQTADGLACQQPGKNSGEHADELETAGYQQMRIRILGIRKERLQALSEGDAIAEGWRPPEPGGEFEDPVEWYKFLWDFINNRAGVRWDDDPEVWVLTFELVTD